MKEVFYDWLGNFGLVVLVLCFFWMVFDCIVCVLCGILIFEWCVGICVVCNVYGNGWEWSFWVVF